MLEGMQCTCYHLPPAVCLAQGDGMSNISVRGLEEETLAALKGLARKEGSSVNALVVRMIEQGIGKRPGKPVKRRYDDLDSLAGAWSADEAAELEAVTASFRQIEPALWE